MASDILAGETQNSEFEAEIQVAEQIQNNLVLGIDINTINKPDYNDVKVANHKSKFEEWLLKTYEAKRTSFVLKKSDYDQIRDVLKGVKKIDCPNKRFQFKKKCYVLIDDQVGRVIDNATKPIAYLEQFFDIIYEIHCVKRLHQGITIANTIFTIILLYFI